MSARLCLLLLAVSAVVCRQARAETWKAYGGVWSQGPQRIENSSEERGAKYTSPVSQQNVQIDADIHMAGLDGEAGLMVRAGAEQPGVDAYRGYFAGVRSADSTLEFGRADFGWNPLVRINLAPSLDFRREFHLRVLAVNCTFAVEASFDSGQRSAIVFEDSGCIQTGHAGVRSTSTAALWRNLHIQPATSADILPLRSLAAVSPPLSRLDMYSADHTVVYEDSLRIEAQKRALQAGVEPIIDFLMQPGRHPNVTLQGTVISLPPLVAIQDDTNALIIPHVDPHVALKLGDMVIAHGTVVSENFRSSLEDADLRVLWSDLPVPPLSVTAAQLTGGTYRGRSIALEGTLLPASNGNGQDLILRDNGLLFRGVSTVRYRIDPSRYEAGSRLRLYGLATSLDDFTKGTYPFAILVHQVDVISAPPWWSARHIALVVIACFALILIVQLSVHRMQQWHLESMVHQREQLAFEMHDTLAQSFTGIAYQLNAARMERRGEEQVQAHITHALEMAQMSHREASRTIAALRPQLRDAAALVEMLSQSALRLADDGSIAVTGVVTGRTTMLPVQISDALFRIGQEALSNAIQHGHATRIEIAFCGQRRQVCLTVADNGRGFDPTQAHPGLGLAGMRRRADRVRAQLQIHSAPGGGTSIAVLVPLPIAGGLVRALGDMLKPTSAGARGLDSI